MNLSNKIVYNITQSRRLCKTAKVSIGLQLNDCWQQKHNENTEIQKQATVCTVCSQISGIVDGCQITNFGCGRNTIKFDLVYN